MLKVLIPAPELWMQDCWVPTNLDNIRIDFAVAGVKVLLEILVAALKDQRETAVAVQDIVQVNDVPVLELLQEADLPQRRTWHALQTPKHTQVHSSLS